MAKTFKRECPGNPQLPTSHFALFPYLCKMNSKHHSNNILFNLEVSGWFSSPSVWGGTYLTKSLGSLDLAIQKQFLNKKLNARLAFSDVLFTSPWRADATFPNLVITADGGNDSRQVRFNLSYIFGSEQVKKARSRSTGLEEEKNRIGS